MYLYNVGHTCTHITVYVHVWSTFVYDLHLSLFLLEKMRTGPSIRCFDNSEINNYDYMYTFLTRHHSCFLFNQRLLLVKS